MAKKKQIEQEITRVSNKLTPVDYAAVSGAGQQALVRRGSAGKIELANKSNRSRAVAGKTNTSIASANSGKLSAVNGPGTGTQVGNPAPLQINDNTAYNNQPGKNKYSIAAFSLSAFLLFFVLFFCVLPLKQVTYQEPIVYEDTETYTEQEPYNETVYYSEREPYTTTEAYTVNEPYMATEPYYVYNPHPMPPPPPPSDNTTPPPPPPPVIQYRQVIHYASVTRYRDVVHYQDVQKSMELVKFRPVQKQRTVARVRQETRTKMVPLLYSLIAY